MASGSRVGVYEVVSLLGAGGMGEVYRARDTKLNREVALKVLPDLFAHDADRVTRFTREAQTLASLNHPNIAAIYGVEEDGPVRALVMELVEGEDLAQVIARGPIAVADALAMARQIADALEAAHDSGVIHRDLKPANVKVTPDGKVKVLDFGLAKAYAGEPTSGAPAALTQSPTLAHTGTQMGLILGTAAYMSPEQARGRPVDRRADIWAFGAVLYEMLTGKPLFSGETVSDVLAAVLKTEADFAALPADTPSAVRRLLRRCLERDPRKRLQAIGDARLEIDEAPERPEQPAAATPRAGGRRGFLVLAVAAGAVLGAAVGGIAVWRARPAPDAVSWKLSLAPPAGLTSRSSPHISPDGRSMAYLADGRLWMQDLGGLTPREVPRSEGATALTWSPDSSSLAFSVRTQLLRTQPNGDVTQIANLKDPIAAESGGIAWIADDTIVFSTGDSGLLAVPAAGGAPRSLLEPDKAHESDFHEPVSVAGGRGVAFIVHRTPEGVSAIDLFTDGKRSRLFQDDGRIWLQGLAWSTSGHLLYGTGGFTSGVWALPVEPRNLVPTGKPFLVAAGGSVPSISIDGTLLLSNFASSTHHRLAIVGLDGARKTSLGDPLAHVDHASFSPDGKWVAFCAFEQDATSVWVYDVERQSRSRLWSNAGCGGLAQGLAWSPDGERLAMSDSHDGSIRIRRRDGSDAERKLADGAQPELSRDGRWLLFTRTAEGTTQDIWVLPLEGGGAAEPLLATKASEQEPRLSPDGRYVAYVSDETGHTEIHLRPFPKGAGRWQVSTAGGDMPRWSADGKRLYYLQDGDSLMQVDVDLRAAPLVSDPRPLFSATSRRLGLEHGFDPAPDGAGFVTVELENLSGGGDLTLIRPWPPAAAAR